ncbi:MAG TPA: hypothetical protein VKA83_09190 [Methylomirabilota bacterium]|nr:hypothetical protein [Methylomirabilota bacterium]
MKSRLTIVRNCKRAGMTRAEVAAKIRGSITEASTREGWSKAETAMALAEWHRHLDKVFGKEEAHPC